MLNQLAIAEVGNAMLGNVIVVSGSFLILLALLKHFAWGPISDILKKREDKIANDLDSAEQSRINSAKMEQEREQQLLASRSDAADIIKNAKESGELSRQNILKDAQEEAARLKSKAQADITVERDSALNSVKTMLQNYLFKSRKNLEQRIISRNARIINQSIYRRSRFFK